MKGSCYISVVNETIARAWNSQQEKIAAAAEQIAEAIKRKNNVFIFGCSHAGILSGIYAEHETRYHDEPA